MLQFAFQVYGWLMPNGFFVAVLDTGSPCAAETNTKEVLLV
jgi:hypothetical protein